MNNLITIISNIKGCQFGSMTLVNDVKCKAAVKKELGTITKKVEYLNIQVGANYENAANNHLERQGDERTFVAESLPWGQWVSGQENKIIEHNGNLYMRYYKVKNTVAKVTYMVNGVDATPDQVAMIESNLYASSSNSKKQEAAGLSEEDQVKPEVVRFDNVQSLNINHETYVAEAA